MHPSAVLSPELEENVSTDRDTHEDGSHKLFRIEQVLQVLCVFGHSRGSVPHIGKAVSAQIRKKELISRREPRCNWFPEFVMDRKRMEQNDWKTSAQLFIVELDIIAANVHSFLKIGVSGGASTALTEERPRHEPSCSQSGRQQESRFELSNHRICVESFQDHILCSALFGKFVLQGHLQHLSQVKRVTLCILTNLFPATEAVGDHDFVFGCFAYCRQQDSLRAGLRDLVFRGFKSEWTGHTAAARIQDLGLDSKAFENLLFSRSLEN